MQHTKIMCSVCILNTEIHAAKIKGTYITKLCKDEKYTIMMMCMKSYTVVGCKIFKFISDKNLN